MTIPGTSMEPPPDGQELDPNAPPPAEHDDDEGLIETVKVGEQQMAPIAEVIRYRKEARAAKRELDALKPKLEQADRVAAQLQQLQPALEAIQRMTPAQQQALAAGRMPSPEGTPHDAEDVEAKELAMDLGLIAQDGSLDIARARKRLDKDNARFERMLEQRVAPVRQTAAQQQAAVLRQQAAGVKHPKTNAPLATQESIAEAYGMLPPELAAQPNVAMVALGTAMLIDAMKNRTPASLTAEYGPPLFSEPASGRRGPSLSAEERAIAAKVGLTDKDLTAATAAINSSGRGVRME